MDDCEKKVGVSMKTKNEPLRRRYEVGSASTKYGRV